MINEYVAGRVNIGDEEIKHRRLTYGWGGLTLAIALFLIFIFFNVSFYTYLLLFFPIYISFIGFLQAREKFCIAYGKSGVCNVSGQVGETRDVVGRLNRNKDRQKASKMLAVSLTGSGIITLAIAALSSL
ncbi:hypothetical protein KY385_02800 [Candidatus Parcubacteria bacterium]|nr:hypothetical protein [Candidatus Parcubacteria bacterium]